VERYMNFGTLLARE